MKRRLIRSCFAVIFVFSFLALLGNQSCSGALQEAERATEEDSIASPNRSSDDAELPALPSGPDEADELLKDSGPEVISPHVDE